MLESAGRSYRFGRFRIDDQEGLLFRDGKCLPLPPSAAHALLFLSRPGHVWEKAELIDALWAGISVGERSLTVCIFELRRALRGSFGGIDPIETIPGLGYRWVGPVEIADGAESTAPRTARPTRTLEFLARGLAVLLMIAVAVTAILVGSRPPAPISRVRPFTSYPGGEYEPAFSPEGARLAFVWDGPHQDNFDIYVRKLASEELTRVTSDAAGEGSPAWSPDGQMVAFVRYGETGSDPGVYIASATGGACRKITGLLPLKQLNDGHLAWSPVNQDIAFVDRPTPESPFSIHLVQMDGSRRTTLTRPPAQSRGDTSPAFSRDGRCIAFKRTMSAGDSDIYVIPGAGRQPRRLTFDARYIAGLAWSADGRYILFSSNRGGRLELWAIPFGGGSPSRVGTGDGANFLSIARNGNRLAWSNWFANTNIYEYELADLSRPPRPIATSTRAEMSPAWSPDGTHIAFRSERSGTPEIWMARRGDTAAQQLTSFGGPITGSPAWSPDGRLIAFDSTPLGRGQIFVLDLGTRKSRALSDTSVDSVLPCWSQDGQWVYFASNRTGSWQIWKVKATGDTGAPIQVTQYGGFAPRALGTWIYYVKGGNSVGLWRVAADGSREEAVLGDLPAPGLWGYWGVSEESIFLADTRSNETFLVMATPPEMRALKRVGLLPKPMIGDSGFGISPGGKYLAYAKADEHGSDILLAEPFRFTVPR
jgi:Tol biopolymer transport system component/DNA-binding winged helix-turn-helix (wHTH) protein